MDNPEKLATLGTQDTTWRQTIQKHNKCVDTTIRKTNTNDVYSEWVSVV
jgi:hypothetical protein